MFFPNNVIFIHIAKTGGSSLEYNITKQLYYPYKEINNAKEVEDYAYKHFSIPGFFNGVADRYSVFAPTHRTIGQYQEHIDISKYEKFSIIRNPLDQVASLYNMFREAASDDWGKMPKMTINDCILEKNKNNLPPIIRNWERLMDQYSYVHIDEKVAVDKLFVFDRYREVQEYVEDTFKIKIDNSVRLWKTKNYNQEINEEAKEYLHHKFRRSFELYESLI